MINSSSSSSTTTVAATVGSSSSSSSSSSSPSSTSDERKVHHHHHHRRRRRQFYTEKDICNIKEILEGRISPSSSSSQNWFYYYVKNKFKLRSIDGDDDIVLNRHNNNIIIPLERIYSNIDAAHVACGHGGEKRTYYELKNHRNVANITSEQIRAFISLCETCQKKNNRRKRKKSCSSIISSRFGERGQVDLIDLTMNRTDDGYSYILNYQDHLTKYLMLKPLKAKTPERVNEALLEIFTTIGAPEILQCDNGTEFSRIETEVLAKYWPNCKLIHSRPRHPQSQGSIERANGDVMNMLRSWMDDDDDDDSNSSSSSWVNELKFIQFQKNNSFNRTIQCSPFKAVFGRETPTVFNYDNNNNNISNDNVSEMESENCEDNSLSVFEMGNEIMVNSSSNNDDDDIANIDDILGINEHYDDLRMDDDDDDGNFSLLLSDISEDENISSNLDNPVIADSAASSSLPHYMDVMQNIENVNEIRNHVSQQLLNAGGGGGDGDGETTIICNGTPVTLKIPKMDTHKLGFPNIIGVIHKYFPDIKKYKVKTRYGLIDRLFAIEDLEVCPNLSISMNDNNDDDDESTSLSLRQLARLDSIKFVGCKCFGKCQNNKCFCYKHKRLCSNVCKHKQTSDICLNKKFEKTIRTRRQQK